MVFCTLAEFARPQSVILPTTQLLEKARHCRRRASPVNPGNRRNPDTLVEYTQRKEPAMQDLSGKRIAILATNGFEQSELTVPHLKLKDAGATVEVVSP